MFLGLHFVISESNNRIFSDDYEVRKGTSSICIPLQHTVALRGDIRVEFYNYKPKTKRKVYCNIYINLFDITEINEPCFTSFSRKRCFIFGLTHFSSVRKRIPNATMAIYMLKDRRGHLAATAQPWNYRWLCRMRNLELDHWRASVLCRPLSFYG